MPKHLLPTTTTPPEWTFLSNHTHVLVCLYLNPDLLLREVAQIVQITERSVQNILADLEEAGVVDHSKEGRRNHYTIHLDKPLRHPLESHHTIGELLKAIAKRSRAGVIVLAVLCSLPLASAWGAAAPRLSLSARAGRSACLVSGRPLARASGWTYQAKCA